MRIFFQNPTKGPLITVAFDDDAGPLLAFVPAAMDCGAKAATTAGVAAGTSLTGLAALAAIVPGDSSPKPLPGINRFAPRAIIDDVEAAQMPNPTARAVDLPGDPTDSATAAADVNPLANLAAAMKDWDGVAPLEIAGFKFEKIADADGKPTVKITISTDNVQDIIDAARVIQEGFPETTHAIEIDMIAPRFRWNLIMWAHTYFADNLARIKAAKDDIFALSQKLERGEALTDEDQAFIMNLEDIMAGIHSRSRAFNRDVDLIRFFVVNSPSDSVIRRIWDGFIHDSGGRTHTLLLGFEAFPLLLKSGHALENEDVESFDTIISPSLEYIIKKAISLSLEEIALGKIKVNWDRDQFALTYANDAHFAVLVDILANLISNAARYSNPQKQERELNVTVRRTNDGYEIEVRDNGIGIPADKLNDIGQFGFRVGEKPVDGSHGHGLWQTQQNLHDLGWGKLHVESTHGMGSRFWFTIPEH